MKKRNKRVKQILAVLLSMTMIFTMLPGVTADVNAASGTARAGENVNFVSMPITIRDYAADGMLFQWNELGATGDQVVGATLPDPTVKYTAQAGGGAYNATTGDGYVRYTSTSTGIYITYSVSGSHTRTSMRYGVVKYRTNAGYSSQPTIGHRWNNGGSNNYVNFPADGYNQSDFKSVVVDLGSGSDTVSHVTMYPRLEIGAYIDIAEVAFFSSKTDADNYVSGTATGGETYHHGGTRGYGLLQTIAADHFNDLSDSAAISGTTLTQNGTWNSAEVTTSEATLNSGAKQTLYGCYVRTDLVAPKLDANKKPVYTEATVTYLAKYMQKTLPEGWKNSDGSYNMWYVMGTKMFDDNNKYVGNTSSATRDLATVLRKTITGGLGSYADTKGKNLNEVTDCTTYFDAAYFLLHNTFSDNTGYGQTVNEYNTLQLVEKNVDGKTYYVYNSAYDGTEYDLTNKTIYNTQTDKITTREGTTYVRGNLQPESRFDPIGAIGDGNQYYGKNGDAYANAVGDTSNDKYYNETNYNLTLEGHAKFIYYDDADLYFNFTGDDDVYLYINGIRVMDMGGAHAISKCGISLNDVRDLCGLKDGEVYDFDFYYMERHGTAANFGIETNIKIVDPSMLTTKTGYQNGGEVGYNGYVDPQKPVQYQFGLQNNGAATIQNLTFRDDDIGVDLTKDSISLNSETTIKDLVVTKYDTDGTVLATHKDMTDEATLKQVLAEGLEVGQKLTIYGFNYTIPEGKWKDNSFVNHVYTTGESTGDNASKQTLNGTADYKVQKQEYTFTPLHYYDWGTLDTSENAAPGSLKGGKSKSVTATKEELLKAVTDAGVKLNSSENAKIELCTPSGGSSGNINTKAKINSDGSITYTGSKTGTDSYYYLVKDGTATYGPVRVDVYTYGVADNVYVLDYSLPVELNDTTVGENGVQTGFTANDVVSLGSSNPNATEWSMTGISDATSNYGEFAKNDQSLTYTMNKIMNDEDSVQVTVEVKEAGADAVTKTTGVTMTQKVITAPASVVHYEDNFAGINYVGDDGNQWVTYETVDSEGNMQSADQDSNYGSDPNYEADKQGTLTANTDDLTEAEKEKAQEVINTVGGTLEGDASNGTITATKVNTTGEILNFEFDGTGFEIISRTTSNNYAVLSVKVTNTKTSEVVKQFPVITECVNGDLYQVPVISVKDLSAGSYKVSLSAARSTETAIRVVYIDGIRIYGALEGKTLEITNEDGKTETVDKTDEYYSDDEKDAKITQVKTLIKDGKVAYADVDYDDSHNPILVSGTTMIEDYEEGSGFVLMEDSLDEYLTFGPNNELYLDGTSSTAIVAFYLTPTGDDEKTRTVQIGVHRKNSSEGNSEAVNMVYGSNAEQVAAPEEARSYKVKSGTEQYYTIDTSKLTPDKEGRYLVLIGTNGGKNTEENTLAITNLKLSGYELASCEEEIQKEDNSLLNEARTFRSLRMADEEPAPEVKINENLSITSAKFKTTKVVSGKSVTLSVVTTGEADAISITDKDGNEVTVDKSSKKNKDGKVDFTFVWKVTGKKGEELTYTVRAKDASGALSVNEKTVSITVR
ncbi:MAG: fibro-slime domain-containing protein [Anaerostipes sp.]|nr:fibro-slime domain-containing protein [Anaerostipes sp.]